MTGKSRSTGRTLRVIGLVVTVAAGVGALSCNDRKAPNGPAPVPPPNPPGLSRLQIVAPASIEPGELFQLTASAVRSDGSSEDVTGQTQWTSGDPAVVEVDTAGVAHGRARGEASVHGHYAGHSTSVRLLVLPDGTFRVSGRVADTGVPLSGVTVSVVAGTGTGLETVTNEAGNYWLYGVGGSAQLRAEREGYQDRIEAIHVDGHRTVDFALRPSGDRRDLRGTYALDITAADCAAPLPAGARLRSYAATVEQSGPTLFVRLSGAEFIVVKGRGNSFAGFVAADDTVTFSLGAVDYSFYYYFYYGGLFDVAERFGPMTALIVNGTVSASASPTTIAGTLTGTIALAPKTTPPFWPRSLTCASAGHRFEMRRQ